MRLQQYQSSDVEMAVRQARTDLGEEAMLVTVEQSNSAPKNTRFRVTFATQVGVSNAGPTNHIKEPAPAPFTLPVLKQIDSKSQPSSSQQWKSVRSELTQLAEELGYPLQKLEVANAIASVVASRTTIRPPGGQSTAVIGRAGCGKSTAIRKLALREALAGGRVVVVRAFQPEQPTVPELTKVGVLQLTAASLGELEAIYSQQNMADLILADIPAIVANPGWAESQPFQQWLLATGVTVHLAISALSPFSQWWEDALQFGWFEPAYLLLSHLEEVTNWVGLGRAIQSTGLECSYFSAGAEITSPIEFASPDPFFPDTNKWDELKAVLSKSATAN